MQSLRKTVKCHTDKSDLIQDQVDKEEEKLYVISIKRWLNERDEFEALSGALYVMRSRKPTTEPWRTPHHHMSATESSRRQ